MTTDASTRVLVISRAHGIQEFERVELGPELVGHKAFGISMLPAAWVPAFFCLSPDYFVESQGCSRIHLPTSVRKMLQECADTMGWNANTTVYVRSSAIDEDITQRGRYLSRPCTIETAFDAIVEIYRDALTRSSPNVLGILVQQSVSPSALHGHLSNERRLSRESRDWIMEYFEPHHVRGVVESFSVRGITKTGATHNTALACPYHDRIAAVLRNPAAWATRRRERLHFEWVWDEHRVWMVQADAARESIRGKNPTRMHRSPTRSSKPQSSSALLQSLDPDKHAVFRKLRNAIEYERAGLPSVPFWIVRNGDLVKRLISGSDVPEVENEAKAVAFTPVVMRTDIANAGVEDTQMLPRSDTLRSPQAVMKEMREAAAKLAKICSDLDRIGFIFHRYLPAVSAAFCYATPDERKVRIESVWGFADGLSYFSHDTFEVDCGSRSLGQDRSEAQVGFRLKEKIRYKSQMLAYDETGRWVVEPVVPPWDWKRSITYNRWVYDIAYFTKRFAQHETRRINMMWFIGVDGSQVPGRLLPWYHEEANLLSPIAKAPDSRRIVTQYPIIRDLDDIERLIEQPELFGRRVTSVRLDPAPQLIRDRDFAARVAQLSKIRGIHIELAGGILSHTFYMLKEAGAVVDCIDPFESGEDTESFGKLVRDKIPDRIADRGELVAEQKLDGEKVIDALKSKLIEEAVGSG